MEGLKGRINPIVFGIAALCFLLPFVKLSCGDMEFASITGLQMVTGAKIDSPQFDRMMQSGEGAQMEGMTQNLNLESSTFALVALIACLFGFLFSFTPTSFSRVARTFLGAAGAVALIVLKVTIESKVTSEGQGVITASSGTGFWAALVLLGAAFFINIFYEKQESRFESHRRQRPLESKVIGT